MVIFLLVLCLRLRQISFVYCSPLFCLGSALKSSHSSLYTRPYTFHWTFSSCLYIQHLPRLVLQKYCQCLQAFYDHRQIGSSFFLSHWFSQFSYCSFHRVSTLHSYIYCSLILFHWSLCQDHQYINLLGLMPRQILHLPLLTLFQICLSICSSSQVHLSFAAYLEFSRDLSPPLHSLRHQILSLEEEYNEMCSIYCHLCYLICESKWEVAVF